MMEPNDVIFGTFEEVSYVDTIAILENVDVSQPSVEVIKVNYFDMYKVFSQFCDELDDDLEVCVETKYKTVAKKVQPKVLPLPEGSNKVMEKASQQPML